MTLPEVLAQAMFALGVGFFIANLLKALESVRWWRRRPTALLVWPGPKPPYYGVMLGIAMVIGLLVLIKAYQVSRIYSGVTEWLPAFFRHAFGELMMFVYYGYMLPFSTRIKRGLYEDGVWTDTTFMPYDQIGGVSWREADPPILVVISRRKMLARHLTVPGQFLGEVRRLFRDKIASHAIEIESGPGLHLGERDVRDSV